MEVDRRFVLPEGILYMAEMTAKIDTEFDQDMLELFLIQVQKECVYMA